MGAMQNHPAIAESRTISPAQLRLLADPVREFIVQSTVPCARTVAELAAGLGCAPTRLYRHVQRLLDEGLLAVEREVKVRGTIERHYRASAKQLKLDRPRFAARGGRRREGLDAILAYVFDQSRADIEGAVAAGRVDPGFVYPDPRSVVAWRNVARVTPAELVRLQKKAHALYTEVDRLARRRNPRGEMVSLAIGLFPCNPVAQRARRAPRKEPRP
jgi:hypothetical protein